MSHLEDLATPRAISRQDGLQVWAGVGGHAAHGRHGLRREVKVKKSGPKGSESGKVRIATEGGTETEGNGFNIHAVHLLILSRTFNGKYCARFIESHSITYIHG